MTLSQNFCEELSQWLYYIINARKMFDNTRKILYNSKANPIISIGGVRKWQYPREKHLRPESVPGRRIGS